MVDRERISRGLAERSLTTAEAFRERAVAAGRAQRIEANEGNVIGLGDGFVVRVQRGTPIESAIVDGDRTRWEFTKSDEGGTAHKSGRLGSGVEETDGLTTVHEFSGDMHELGRNHGVPAVTRTKK